MSSLVMDRKSLIVPIDNSHLGTRAIVESCPCVQEREPRSFSHFISSSAVGLKYHNTHFSVTLVIIYLNGTLTSRMSKRHDFSWCFYLRMFHIYTAFCSRPYFTVPVVVQ